MSLGRFSVSFSLFSSKKKETKDKSEKKKKKIKAFGK